VTGSQRVISRHEGFTLIELLLVLVIISNLLAIAVPSYLGFKDRADQTAANADVQMAIASAEAFYSDNGSYTLMNLAALSAINITTKLDHVKIINSQTYCLDKSIGGAKAKTTRGQNAVASGNVLQGSSC
jgi:prepilin-type N-terminal cleavage/methylation domain-containing protein